MQGIWDVFYYGNKVGTCNAREVGLYSVFNCSCRVKDSQIYRLYIRMENRDIRLGIPQPTEKGLTLTARLPSSALPDGLPSFELIPLGEEAGSKFVPIVAGEPFLHLDKIECSVLVCRNGQIGICVQ